MGETAAETLTEIASVRDALERDISTLGDRMPPKETIVKGAAAAGGGLAALATLVALVVKKLSDRAEERELRHEAEVHADAVAEALARRARRVADDGHLDIDLEAHDEDDGGGGLLWALLALLAGFAAAFAWMRGRAGGEDAAADPGSDAPTAADLPTRPRGTTLTS